MAWTREQQKDCSRAWYLANCEKVKARVKAYAIENREAVSATKKAYREVNRERVKSVQAAHYVSNKAHRNANHKAYVAANRDAVKAYKAQWYAAQSDAQSKKGKADRLADPQKFSDRKRRYYQANKDKWPERCARRKARILGTRVAPIDYKRILRESKGLCGICNKPLNLFGTDFDHIIPLARGGTHTYDNLQASHASCNRSKGARVA